MAARKRSQKTRKPGTRQTSPRAPKPAQGAAPSPWIYGLHAVSAALSNPRRKCQRLVATRETAGIFEGAEDGPAVEIVGRQEIDSYLPPGAVHQGVALLASPLPTVSVEDIAAHAAQRQRTLVVALDQVTDPQNVGAVLRSAAAFGAFAVLVPDRHTPETSGALAKAASGAIETVPVIRPTNLVRALETLKSDGFWVVGLDVDAPASLADTDLPDRCILALGAEGKGLRRLTGETCDLMASIPMSGAIQSLNVSASAAIALYEWIRQKS
ncbi:MAG: 23S rRNA (guanosine(2251)-2'-O)-methyltransferase RlmB [Alphaproteobacteria bacterium]